MFIYKGRDSIEYLDALADEKFSHSYLTILRKRKKAADTSANIIFFYREYYNPDYKLIPSVFRNNNLSQESDFYHKIMVHCPEEFKNFFHLGRLVHMQHYSYPTRLLDVTSNPLVALFFACKNFGHEEYNKSGSGKVFVFCIPGESTIAIEY